MELACSRIQEYNQGAERQASPLRPAGLHGGRNECMHARLEGVYRVNQPKKMKNPVRVLEPFPVNPNCVMLEISTVTGLSCPAIAYTPSE